MTTLFSRGFWAAAGERAIRTFAQTLSAFFVIGTTGLLDLDWPAALSLSGAAAVASVLTSIGSAAASGGTPSFGTEVTTPVADELVVTAARTGLINETTTRRDLHPRD